MITKNLEAVLKAAFDEAKGRRHEFVCVEHLLWVLLEDKSASDAIVNCGGDLDRLRRELEEFFETRLETMPEGAVKEPEQTLGFHRIVQRAFIHAQSSEKAEIQGSDLLVAMYREQQCYARYLLEAQDISRFDLINYVSHGVSKLPEDEPQHTQGAEDDEEGGPGSQRDPLQAFTVELVEKASKGQVDPLIGRSNEIARTLHVLCRRRKNNPIYVGDPGVGKTAIAEGLALRIHEKSVPEALLATRIHALDMGAVLAGTKFRGEFEARLKGIITALKGNPDAILFIDEIHTVVGAGATSGGSLDASNILKPVLASGELKCIGSTTYHDYRSYFERDRALSRRFQRIEIPEPSIDETYRILQGLKPHYEKHHGVSYSQAALRTAARLSARHINDRFLPDKAIDVIDEVGALGADPAAREAQEDHRTQGRGADRRHHGEDTAAQRLQLRQGATGQPGPGPEARGLRPGRGHRRSRRHHQARAVRSRSAREAHRLFLVLGTHRGGQDRSGQAVGPDHGHRVPALRHERVHGEAHRVTPARRARRDTWGSTRAGS